MRFILDAAVPGRIARDCIVLLPGAYQNPADLVQAGFIEAVRSRHLPVDLVLVDLQLAHLTDRSVLPKLRADVVLAARTAGCTNLWCTGISLGGFVSLLYAAQYAGDLDGLLLLSPYPGNRMILSEIGRRGPPENWGDEVPAELAEEQRVWQFIRRPPPDAPPLRLGFGRADRYAPFHRLMARSLPAGSVDEIDGTHDWAVWLQLWNNFLTRQYHDTAQRT